MKLALLGVIAAAIGVALGIPGLIGIGVYWVLLGPVMRLHGLRFKEQVEASRAKAPEGRKVAPSIDGKTFALGTLLFAALGIPSLVVGIGEIGFPVEHADWRWFPLAVGIYAVGFGGIGAVLYLLGSAAEKYVESGPQKTVPATLWIVSVKETGQYINERPRLEFVFRVEPDAGASVAPYEVTKKATTPFTAMAHLRPGDGFRAMVAGPEEPTAMDIAWDEPVPGTNTDGQEVSDRLAALDRLREEAKISEDEYHAQRSRILDSL